MLPGASYGERSPRRSWYRRGDYRSRMSSADIPAPQAFFRHSVQLTLTAAASSERRAALVAGLRSLPDEIDTITGFMCGLDAGLAQGSPSPNADVVLIVDFDDEDGYITYRDHPHHRDVIERLVLPILERRSAIQFWVSSPG